MHPQNQACTLGRGLLLPDLAPRPLGLVSSTSRCESAAPGMGPQGLVTGEVGWFVRVGVHYTRFCF